jgi:hypothetical protein
MYIQCYYYVYRCCVATYKVLYISRAHVTMYPAIYASYVPTYCTVCRYLCRYVRIQVSCMGTHESTCSTTYHMLCTGVYVLYIQCIRTVQCVRMCVYHVYMGHSTGIHNTTIYSTCVYVLTSMLTGYLRTV